MSEIVVLIGPPCSGKSTFVKELIENRPDKNYFVISSDDLIGLSDEEKPMEKRQK